MKGFRRVASGDNIQLKAYKMSAARKQKKDLPENNWFNSLIWFGICLLLITVLSRLI
jgi:hypothetical protein